MSRFHPGLVGLVDKRRDGLESYADVVGHAICQESWMKIEMKLNLSAGEELREKTNRINLKCMGINEVAEDWGFSQGSLIIKTSQVDLVESIR